MKLFPIKQAVTQEQYVAQPQIHTPLGIVQLSLSLSGEAIKPHRNYSFGNGSVLYTYNHHELECELVIFHIAPELPEHMSVEACWVAVFRMQTAVNTLLSDCAFAACWQEGYTWTSYGSSDTGQNLEAAEYSNETYQLHIGTENQEMLMIRRDQGDRVPLSFGQSPDVEWDEQIWNSERGLQVPMSAISGGEMC